MKTIPKIILPVLISTLFACNQQANKNELPSLNKIETIDYREIYKQSLKSGMKIFPLVFDKSIGNKRLIFIGISHSNDNDTLNPMFDTIEKYFRILKPGIALNEGGQIPDSLHYPTKNKAISSEAEIGFLKYLADSLSIKLVNGDCPDSIEVPALLKKYDKDVLLYFLVTQRFIPQFITSNNNIGEEYGKFVNEYLIRRCKLPLQDRETQWMYFRNLYKKYNNNEEIDLEHFHLSKTEYYFYDEGIMGQIGRSSLLIRDSIIVTNIYNNLKKHNKVFVVFGGAHLLSIKPTLDRIFEKH